MLTKGYKPNQKTMMLTKSSLYEKLCDIQGNIYDLCKVKLCKDYESTNLTELILNEKKDVLLFAILKDENGNRSHTVDIDVRKRAIYYCMEEKSYC